MIVHLLCIRKKILPFCSRTNFSLLNKCLEPEIRGPPLSSVTGDEFWKPTKTLIKPTNTFNFANLKWLAQLKKILNKKISYPASLNRCLVFKICVFSFGFGLFHWRTFSCTALASCWTINIFTEAFYWPSW